MSEIKEEPLPIREKPTVDSKVEKLKAKKPKKLTNKIDKVTKVNLTKKEEVKDAVSKSESKENVSPISETQKEEGKETSVGLREVGEIHEGQTPTEEVKEEVKTEETKPVLEEITTINETPTEPVVSTPQPTVNLDLPENVEKLVEFMKDTGGTVEDYVRLNADYSNVDNVTLLKEYYKQIKPHLTLEEVEFLLEDKFAYDEEMDEEREVRKKRLAIKEEVAQAQVFLKDLKNKYYDEIKLRPGITQDQQKAMDFFNRYNTEQDRIAKQRDVFTNTTKNFFNKEFKGFEFNLGEKRFRYGINNPTEVADAQSNISTFVKKFLNEDGSVKDYNGYHKAIFTARNADTIAQHFYEQGKADAVRNINAKSKNITADAREAAPTDVYINGLKVKAISGTDSSKLKFKKRTFNT